MRAARNGRSMEAEARDILARACAGDPGRYRDTAAEDAPFTITLDPDQARAASDHAARHHSSVEDLVHQALDRQLEIDASAWCDRLFARMDETGGNSLGATWTRDELYDR